MRLLPVFLALAATSAPDRRGDCVCDMTSVVCDPNCCCDPDCREGDNEQIVRLAFTRCLKEMYGSRRGVMCAEPPISALEPYYINPYGNIDAVYNSEEEYYSRTLATRESNAERSQVCIVHDNVGLDDASFRPLPAPLTDLELNSIIDASPLRGVWNYERSPPNTWQPAGTPGTENQLPGTWYRVGDRVVAVRLAEQRALPWLFVPQDVAGRCNDEVPARFMRSVLPSNPSICTRRGSLQALCSDPATRNTLRISKWRDIGVSPPLGRRPASQVIGLAVAAQLSILNATGAVLPSNTQTVYDPSNGVCRNAVTEVVLTIAYSFLDTESEDRYVTTAFGIRLVVADVTATPVQQRHSVIWTPDGSTGDPVHRSGNPGYRRGLVIKAGDGSFDFALPFGYSCASATFRQVAFLHDVVSTGCTLEFNLNEFRDVCVQGSQTALLEQAAPSGNASNPRRVAIYGNADPENPSDWVNVQEILDPPDGVGLFDPILQTCTVLAGYDYTFVIRRTGRVYNPQDTIAGVLRKGVYTTWQFTKEDQSENQRFALRWRASFVRQADVPTDNDVIEAPPLLPTVSDDIFYPFRIVRRSSPVEDSEL